MDTKIHTPQFALPTINRRPTLAFKKGDKSVAQKTLPTLLESVRFEQMKRKAENSLYEFVQQSWGVVEPGVPFSAGWHIKVICEHLEAVSERRIKNLIINIPPRHALALDTAVPTVSGWKTMATLRIGDFVFGPDGKPTEVLGKSEVFKDRQLYRVWTDDNEYVDCDEDHLWTVRLDRKYKQYNTYTTGQLWARRNEPTKVRLPELLPLEFDVEPTSTNRHTKGDIGRYIRVEKLGITGDVQCIRVAREDGLFVAGKGCLVTHNSKSTITSVIWPVWAWLRRPEEKFLTASYSSSLSVRDAVKSRRLLESPWFKERWPNIHLNRDQNTKQRYENDSTGYRISASVGGATTGEGGSTLVVDDAHGAQDAQSDTMRNSTLEWLDMVWSSRKNDPKTSCSLIIMQRLHMNDATGHLLKQGGYEHLCLPAEYDGVRRKTSLGEYDPRTEIGELLWPNRFGRDELETLKKALGAYGTSGQLQQNPVPDGGGILKTESVQLWPYQDELPFFQFIMMSLDTAFTEKTSGDPSGCLVLGVFEHRSQQCVMILDAWTEHLSYPDLKQRVMDDWMAQYGAVKDNHKKKGRRPDAILIEEKASGQSLLQDMRLSNIPALSYNPGRASKTQRAHLMAPILESNCIYVMESKKHPGKPITWVQNMLKEWAEFPVSEHDEYVDTATQALIYLKDAGWLDTPKIEDEEPESYSDDSRPTANPYLL